MWSLIIDYLQVLRNGSAVTVQCCCNMKGEKITRMANQSKDFESKSLITFNPTPGQLNQWIGLLDKSNKKKVRFYCPYTNSFRSADGCTSDCIVPPFVDQMDDNLLKKLDAVVEYGWDQLKPQGWLLFFNKDSKPQFCFTEKDRLSEGVRVLPWESLVIMNHYLLHPFLDSANHKTFRTTASNALEES